MKFVDRTGEIGYNNQGEKMTIIAYRGCEDIDVQFEDGGISYNKSYGNFKKGKIKNTIKNSIAYNYPEIAKMIAIKENNLTFEDCYNISCYSNNKFYFKCDKCNIISKKKTVLSDVIRRGYSCKFCSDGLPITEKFMTNILKQLNLGFIYRLNKIDFNWCGYYEYDFYIYNFGIIEINGEQHYKNSKKFKRSLEEEKMNDLFKYKCAKNNVDNYIVIDCRYSELEWMKNNIIKELSTYFDLSNIDWELAWEESQNSLCVKTWELWNNGDSVTIIKDLLNLSRNTTIKYLKIGTNLNKCNYTAEESYKRVIK